MVIASVITVHRAATSSVIDKIAMSSNGSEVSRILRDESADAEFLHRGDYVGDVKAFAVGCRGPGPVDAAGWIPLRFRCTC